MARDPGSETNVSKGGEIIEGHWEQLIGSDWLPWMDVTLSRD
jgi:hypothetical protein